MYEDLIANLNPKPQFNLKSYKNEDFYSEGEIEPKTNRRTMGRLFFRILTGLHITTCRL